MAGGSYIRAYVRCPFYRYDDHGKKKVTCEGLSDGSTVSQVWKSKRAFDKHTEKKCCGNYEECPVYRMLMTEKYNE